MENLPERRAGPRQTAWAWRLTMETGRVAGEPPKGDPPTFTSSVGDSQRETAMNHQVTNLSPERRSRGKVRNARNRPGPLAAPHTGRLPPSPCFQDGGWECTHLPKGPIGVCQEPNLRRKQKSQKNLHLGPDPLQDPQLTLPSALWARAHSSVTKTSLTVRHATTWIPLAFRASACSTNPGRWVWGGEPESQQVGNSLCSSAHPLSPSPPHFRTPNPLIRQ